MTDTTTTPVAAPQLRAIAYDDIKAALNDGWADFRAAPSFGLFFSAFYVLGSVIILLQLSVLQQSWWILPVAVGFPILGPFAAIGLYEVSRRLETKEPLDWARILSVVIRERDSQIPFMVAIIFMIFLFWVYAAHLIFALFFGLKAMTNVMSSPEIFYSIEGALVLLIGSVVGAAICLFMFATTVFGLPLLLDREIDMVTATIASVQAVKTSPGPMLGWGLFVALAMFVAMAPMFLGLFIVLPVLGHATWRLYRKATTQD